MKLSVVGGPGYIDRSFSMDTDKLFGLTGRNTGNLVFWYAFNMHVQAIRKEYFAFNFSEQAVDAINKTDALVFIFANHVNKAMDLGHLVPRLERVEVPIIAIGLGAQSRLGEDIDWLPEGSVKFFQLLSSKTKQIGVRGEFTQNVLRQHGIENTVVLGCISNFLVDKLEGKIVSFDPDSTKYARIGLNNDLIESLQPLNEMVSQLFPRSMLDFIVQAPVELLHLARNELGKVSPEYMSRLEKIAKPFAAGGFSEREIFDRLYAFYDARAWFEHVRRYDLTLGSRMHGNMVSFQAGVPTIFVPHDSRTDELARTMELPRFELSECRSTSSPKELFQKVEFDVTRYFSRRRELKGRYISLLHDGGLKPSKFLESL